MEVTITLPTLNELLGWFLVYIYLGLIPWFIQCVSVVWCDYGRVAKSLPIRYLAFTAIVDLILWPFNFHHTKQNLGGFNREVDYYR